MAALNNTTGQVQTFTCETLRDDYDMDTDDELT